MGAAPSGGPGGWQHSARRIYCPEPAAPRRHDEGTGGAVTKRISRLQDPRSLHRTRPPGARSQAKRLWHTTARGPARFGVRSPRRRSPAAGGQPGSSSSTRACCGLPRRRSSGGGDLVAEADPDPVPPTTLGDPAECPVCGTVVGEFLPAGSKRIMFDRRCPECRSLERHHAVWLCFQARTNLFDEQLRMLHIAPEGRSARATTLRPAQPSLPQRRPELAASDGPHGPDRARGARQALSTSCTPVTCSNTYLMIDRQSARSTGCCGRGVGRCSSSRCSVLPPGGRLGVGPDGA